MTFSICLKPLDSAGDRGAVQICIEPATNGNLRLTLRRPPAPLELTAESDPKKRPRKVAAAPVTVADEVLGELSLRELQAAIQGAQILINGGPVS